MGGALLLDAQLLDFAVERTLRHEEFGSRLTASAVVVFQSLDNLLALHVGLGPLARGSSVTSSLSAKTGAGEWL